MRGAALVRSLTNSSGVFYASAMATRKAASKRSQPGTAGYGALAGKIVERWREVGEEVALDRVVSEFGDVPRYDVVAALKQLEKAGAGEFVAGHGGRKSRFVWRARAAPEASRPSPPTAREPSRAGKGQAPVVKAAAAPSAGAAPSPGAGTLDHAFSASYSSLFARTMHFITVGRTAKV